MDSSYGCKTELDNVSAAQSCLLDMEVLNK